jgi:hypothetical protein
VGGLCQPSAAIRPKVALILFERSHIVQYLNQGLDEVRRRETRRLTMPEKVNLYPFRSCRSPVSSARHIGRVEDWRQGSVGWAYPLALRFR